MIKEIGVSFVIGLILSPLAALMVFLISYNEYLHHFPDKKKPFKLALESAFFTLFLFLLLSLIIGLTLSHTFS